MVKGAALLISSWPRGALAALDKRLGRETGVAVHVAEDLLRCVAVGGRRYLE
jgi:actin-like ATPase involved in cell morphogenesis